MGTIDKKHLFELLDKHAELTEPNPGLTLNILDVLGLLGTCDLGTVLNSSNKEERGAGLDMIKKHIEDLMSENAAKSADAKETLEQFYYCIDTSDILEP